MSRGKKKLVRKQTSEMGNIQQKQKEEEGDTREPPNRFKNDTRGRKTIFSDNDNKNYLDMHNYRELVRLQNEYQDGVFGPKFRI